ncbi:MAG: hypothetical protein ABI318_06530 [Chthoniobacteraceae bacterium]
MKTIVVIVSLFFAVGLRAQIPVTDALNLVNNQLSEVENLAKWVESIAQLKQQIQQLDQQISIGNDLRKWAGDPQAAGTRLLLDSLGAQDLIKDYGRAKAVIYSATNSLDSLSNTGSGKFRAIANLDLEGNAVQLDQLAFRRFAILDAVQANTDQVTSDTKDRESKLQDEVASTLEVLKAASTAAEAQKVSAKLSALNGQLGQIEATRRREVDAVAMQKIANDSRQQEERQAAAELAAKDDFLANQRVSSYMNALHLRRQAPDGN